MSNSVTSSIKRDAPSFPSASLSHIDITTSEWTVDAKNNDIQALRSQLKEAAALLVENEVVGFPTETVYGLGGNALSSDAISKIFKAKGRPSDNPLIVHVSSIQMMEKLVDSIPPIARVIMDTFWPGPLSIILKVKDTDSPISSLVTAGLDTVAIRMPNHPVALALIEESDLPIAAPSANLSGKPSPTTAEHVLSDLRGRIAGCVDGGATVCAVGVESTVIDCTNLANTEIDTTTQTIISSASGSSDSDNDNTIYILRPGGITKEDLEEVVGPYGISVSVDASVKVKKQEKKEKTSAPATAVGASDGKPDSSDKATTTSSATDNTNDKKKTGPRAPGMKYTHYAPKAPVYLVEGSDDYLQSLIEEALTSASDSSIKVGILTTEEKKDSFKDSGAEYVMACGSRSDLGTVANRLYDVLRAFDATDVDIIFSEMFPETGLGQAVMNRLWKASGKKILSEKTNDSLTL